MRRRSPDPEWRATADEDDGHYLFRYGAMMARPTTHHNRLRDDSRQRLRATSAAASHRVARSNAATSEPLDPGSQLHLPRPGAAGLLDHVHIALRDRLGIEEAIGSHVAAFEAALLGIAHSAVDDE